MKSAVPLWGCLADEFDEEIFDTLKKSPDILFENLIEIIEDPDAFPALKVEVTQYMLSCQEDKELKAQVFLGRFFFGLM